MSASPPGLTGHGFTPAWPMAYLKTFGPRADPATSLTWGMTWLSVAVILIVAGLVVGGVIVRRARSGAEDLPPIVAGASGLSWIYVGLALTGLALIAALVWTVAVVAAVDSPPRPTALTVRVTGRQWWWQVDYPGDATHPAVVTANEIHIPAGAPIKVELVGADVIHSFWIPSLTGKTDTIPGRTNLAWLQADRPGVYRGQCTEYCGAQHAHMAAYVIAEPPAAFEAWRQAQGRPAAAPADPADLRGRAVFVDRCSKCHSVRGVRGRPAGDVVGPDLTHLMSRSTLAAGLLANDRGGRMGWIANPEALKPGSRMPATLLGGADLEALEAYLETLR
jgi:cytochrome c oxidase subunit 2